MLGCGRVAATEDRGYVTAATERWGYDAMVHSSGTTVRGVVRSGSKRYKRV
jgi:hypothetical protein